MKRLLALFTNTFYKRIRTYTIDQPKEIVVQHLNNLFTKEYGYFLDKETSFISDPTFTLQPTDLPGYSNILFERKSAYLKGKFYTEEKDRTIIEISIRPNYVCLLLFIASLIIGLSGISQLLINSNKTFAIYTGVSVLLIGSIISIALARIFGLSFLDKFENFMQLKPRAGK